MAKSIKKIIYKTKKLLQHYQTVDKTNFTLKESIIHVYYLYILSKLDVAFERCKLVAEEVPLENIQLIQKQEQQLSKDAIFDLQQLLKKNWGLVCDTFLSYTALPKSKVTALLCSLSQTLAFQINQENPAESISPLHLLIPDLSTDSIDENYPDLLSFRNQLVNEITSSKSMTESDLLTLFETHICGKNGAYLIPVSLLYDKKHYLPERKTFQNPYYNYKKHTPNQVTLCSSEYERLIRHSLFTVEYEELRNHYESFFKDTYNLLGRLYELCQKLRFNSIDGVGEELDAASGAYAAILDFAHYYSSLQDEIEKIPEAVHKEIKILLVLSSDPEKNTEATENIATCIASRRNALENVMKGHEAILASIALDGLHKQNLIEYVQKDLEKAEEIFRQSFANNTYTGTDYLACRLETIQHLGINLHFSTVADIDFLKTFSAEEMRIFLNETCLDEVGCFFFDRLNELILLAYDLPLDKCEAFFENLSLYSKFWNHLLVYYREQTLASILTSLDPERCRIVASSMKQTFNSPIYESISLRIIFANLNSSYRKLLYPIYKKELLKTILTASHFEEIFSYFQEEERTELYNEYKFKMNYLINSSKDFKAILHHLDLTQREEMFEQYKTDLPYMISSAAAFGDILDYLNPMQRDETYERYKNKLNSFVNNITDLTAILKNLTIEQALEVCSEHESKLLHFLHEDDFINEVRNLPYEARTAIYLCYKKNQFHLDKTVESFRQLILPLPKSELEHVLEWYLEFFPGIITSIEDYHRLTVGLNFNQNNIIFYTFYNQLLNKIHSSKDFAFLLKHLMVHQRDYIYNNCKSEISCLIQSAQDFNFVFKHLSKEQKQELFLLLKPQIELLIHNGTDLGLVLANLDPNQRSEIYKVIKRPLSALITSSDEFSIFLLYSTFDQKLNLIKLLSIEELENYFQLPHVKTRFFICFEEFNNLIRCMEELPLNHLKIILRNLLSNLDSRHYFVNRYEGIVKVLSFSKFESFINCYHLCIELLNPSMFNELNFLIRRELVKNINLNLANLNINATEIQYLRPWLEKIKYMTEEFLMDHNWKNFLERCDFLNKEYSSLAPPKSYFHFFSISYEPTPPQKISNEIQLTLSKITTLLPSLDQIHLFNISTSNT